VKGMNKKWLPAESFPRIVSVSGTGTFPGFVESEFREFLDCGVLARACGGRRMAETAADLVDRVLRGIFYDVGPNYLVMELVEGATLQGPMPMEDALAAAHQIAEALEAAHEKGITHRDLKPGNIKITPDGRVKVLDFGLAKVDSVTQTNFENSPTLSVAATRTGVILGTAAYMSPEQARGMAVDKRADIWAFGVVMFELLTGKPLFTGQSTTDILAAVVRSDPDFSALPAGTPSSIRRLLKRCLVKDPKKRLPDIGVARLEIDEALATPSVDDAVPTIKRHSVVPWLVAAFAVLGFGGRVVVQPT